MKNFLILTFVALIVSSAFAASSGPNQEIAGLEHARFNTDVAENFLRTTKTDAGGHRAKALAALDTATSEINAAILIY